jgi:hypothetical protein
MLVSERKDSAILVKSKAAQQIKPMPAKALKNFCQKY